VADFRCAEKSKAVGPWKTDGSASATEQEASSLEGMLLVRTKKSYVPRKCAQAAFLWLCALADSLIRRTDRGVYLSDSARDQGLAPGPFPPPQALVLPMP
jgi:hypothetical protein